MTAIFDCGVLSHVRKTNVRFSSATTLAFSGSIGSVSGSVLKIHLHWFQFQAVVFS